MARPVPTTRVRVQVSISSPEALEAIDARAAAEGLTRSAYLERAALASTELHELRARLHELAQAADDLAARARE